MPNRSTDPVVVVGGGFTGLAAGYELARSGRPVVVIESEEGLGGLAGSFPASGALIDRFYHHWFRSDQDALRLVAELGLENHVTWRATRTGLYFNGTPYRLTSPLDVMRFSPLRLQDRVRLGRLLLQARAVKDWRSIEHLTAREWIEGLSGTRVFEVVWAPLLRGKFGPYADRVSAVWFWKKMMLRGGSRSRAGSETLGYFRGGFHALLDAIAGDIRARDGRILTGSRVVGLVVKEGRIIGVRSAAGTVLASAVILATPLPIAADLLEGHVSPSTTDQARQIQHLANVCLVLELDRSLSSTYWMNVSDPEFPFVGVIEHTNLEPVSRFGGRHIVYLSKYLAKSDALWTMDDDATLAFAVPHLRRMFPEFSFDWVLGHHVWRAAYAQPIIEPHYSRMRPPYRTEIEGLYLSTMAHIYPEDRGTNYAVRDGRMVARMVIKDQG